MTAAGAERFALGAAALAELTDCERAFLADPELTPVRDRLAAHAETMARAGWARADAEAMLLGCIVLPLAFGHADGSLNRRVRAGVDMHCRRAAALARELADTLDTIAAEPLPPDEALTIISLLPERLIADDAPSCWLNERPSVALRRLAAGLEREPNFSEAPGLTSRKPSWRDALREAGTVLERLGFELRESEAVRLVGAYARAVGGRPPTRDSVRAALRGLEPPDPLRSPKGYSAAKAGGK